MKNKLSLCVIILSTLIILTSCEKIMRKGREMMSKTEDNIKSKSENLMNKISPQFDPDKSDTKFNKERFYEYLEITPDETVKNIFTYGDFLGADYKVLISFNCNETTLKKIIDKNELEQIDSLNQGLLFPEEFIWWNKEKIKKIKPYRKAIENNHWRYLWYDQENQKVYYEEFSL